MFTSCIKEVHMSSPLMGALILAGGKGTRMHSATPKVLLKILEEPLLYYVYKSLRPIFNDAIWTIVGHGADHVREAFPAECQKAIVQTEQLGTGHALTTGWSDIQAAGIEYLLVVNGDTPQISTETLQSFIHTCTSGNANKGFDLAFMTLSLPDPASFGRVVRQGDTLKAIVEAKDYDTTLYGPEPHEVNAGIYWLKITSVDSLLPQLSNKNKSGEYYITDLIALAVEKGLSVEGVPCGTDARLMGVNSPQELTAAEETIRQQIINHWQEQGVFIRQDNSVRVGPRVTLAKGVDITGPCEMYGETSIETGTAIASHCKIIDCQLGQNITVQSFSHLQESAIGNAVTIGPYARLRPGATLEDNAHIGNFVEVKKSTIGKGAKVNHLTYIGDTTIGEKTNIGAGTITCNYDGKNKHRTTIGKNVFIGSNASLVAPVTIGDGALVGAGSVITKDVAEAHLGIERNKQRSLPLKKRDS